MCSALGAALFALALLQSSVAFLSIGGGASSHKNMTETAILYELKKTCTAVADSSDYEFNLTGPSVEELAEACLGPTATGLVSAAKFRAALQEIHGQPVTLLLSVMGRKGPSSVTVGEVVIVPVSHAEAPSKGFASDMGNGDILVTVDSVPEGEFVAVVGSSAEPGKTLSLPFRVKTEGPGGACSISVRNDRDYPMTYPTVLTLMTGQYANATLEITPPANTPSGTDVTVTIDAKSTTADTNYAVLRLSVVNKHYHKLSLWNGVDRDEDVSVAHVRCKTFARGLGMGHRYEDNLAHSD
ncbi:hypothetical protein CRUP_005088 [Coryphaenoides rupestris]|nr:hypothetical protein CRUP_005088 [Coryphaenoides rupestris]